MSWVSSLLFGNPILDEAWKAGGATGEMEGSGGWLQLKTGGGGRVGVCLRGVDEEGELLLVDENS